MASEKVFLLTADNKIIENRIKVNSWFFIVNSNIYSGKQHSDFDILQDVIQQQIQERKLDLLDSLS